MPTFSRFSDRFYYETKFLDEDLPLWIWDTETNGPAREYEYTYDFHYHTTISVKDETKDYSNTLFKPAEWFTMESTPNYFIIDLYGISAGGYSAYHKHVHHKKYFRKENRHYYASGGSGSVIYLANIKIRIKDENLEGVVYTMSGKRKPTDGVGGSYDWHMAPQNVHTNTDDWCLKLAQPAMTPNGLAPAGLKILGMAAGGNAWEGTPQAWAGSGASAFYIPEQCAFKTSITELPEYTPEVQYSQNQWIRRNGIVYKVNTEFVATNWETDSRFVREAYQYSDSLTFEVNDWFWFEGESYKTRKRFKGDYQNTVLGFADYFLDKSIVSTRVTTNGLNGDLYREVATSPKQPNRLFTEDDINDINSIWVKQSLSWGASQGNSKQGWGGQGGGMAMIYKGESS